MTNIKPLATIATLDLNNVTGGIGAQPAQPAKKPVTAAQRAFAKKIMSQPFPSESIPGLNLM